MARFTLPRDVYHGKGCLSELKNLKGKKAVLVVGGGSMKRQGFLDKAVNYLKEGGMEVKLIEGVEPLMRLKLCGYSMSIRMKHSRILSHHSASLNFVRKQNLQPFHLHQELQQK